MSETGVAWYVGIPESGKTTLAAAHLAASGAANRWPCVVIDTAGVAQLEHVPHVASLEALIEDVWREGVHCAWIPQGEDEIEELCALILDPCGRFGRVNLLVDEAAEYLSAHSRGSLLLTLMRRHRHAHVRMLLTTQHVSGDVPQVAFSCAPDLYLFRCTSSAVLARMEREYGIPSSELVSLPQGTFIHVHQGF